MSLKDRIISGLGVAVGAKPTPTWVLDRRQTVICTVSLPANTPANASNNINFIIDPKVGATTQYTIPTNYKFTLVDIFIKASTDVPVDGIAKLKKNFFEDHVVTPPLSTTLVSNPSRPAVSPKSWVEGETLSGEYINTVAVGSTAQTVTFYLVFDVYKKV